MKMGLPKEYRDQVAQIFSQFSLSPQASDSDREMANTAMKACIRLGYELGLKQAEKEASKSLEKK